ncbi:MAG: transcriptional regulator [Actinomycetota bacterium]|nr:transcriptional regulator [Actinomycetota bacterium]
MKISDDELVDGYAAAVGARLRAVRKQKKLSLQSVEAMSDQEFKASVLGAYERGERSISVPRLQRLAALYDVPIDQLLPKDQFPTSINVAELDDFAATELVIDPILVQETVGRRTQSETKFTIDLNKLNEVVGPERDVLRRYLGMIQVQRQDFNGRMITIRTDDLRVIGCIFEMTLEQMSQRLDDLGLRLR